VRKFPLKKIEERLTGQGRLSRYVKDNCCLSPWDFYHLRSDSLLRVAFSKISGLSKINSLCDLSSIPHMFCWRLWYTIGWLPKRSLVFWCSCQHIQFREFIEVVTVSGLNIFPVCCSLSIGPNPNKDSFAVVKNIPNRYRTSTTNPYQGLLIIRHRFCPWSWSCQWHWSYLKLVYIWFVIRIMALVTTMSITNILVIFPFLVSRKVETYREVSRSAYARYWWQGCCWERWRY
jgi:hypothetical protein